MGSCTSAGLALLALGAMALLVAVPQAARAQAVSGQDLKTVDAKDIRAMVSAEKGKVVLLNFFATWCAPCHKEFPDIVKLQQKYGPEGLQVIEVSVNDASEKADMQKFLSETKPPFPVYMASSYDDDFCSAVDKRWDTALPMTIIYDRTGNSRFYYPDGRTYEQFEKDVKPLLAENTSK